MIGRVDQYSVERTFLSTVVLLGGGVLCYLTRNEPQVFTSMVGMVGPAAGMVLTWWFAKQPSNGNGGGS